MDEQTFLSKITKTDDCWLWNQCVTKAGYGAFSRKNKLCYAHHQSWKLWKSPELPSVIRHKCRNRHCVNPDHLEGGTQGENIRDRARDETDNKGERHGNALLTNENIVEMRRLRREGWKVDDLQRRYNLTSHSAVLNALSGKNWSHIPDPITKEEQKLLRHHKGCVLTDEEITEIKRRFAFGVTKSRLANDFDVTTTTIANILKQSH